MKRNKYKTEEALHHHRMGEYIKAIEILESDDMAGDGDAQLLPGQIYYRVHKTVTGVCRSYTIRQDLNLRATHFCQGMYFE